MLALVALLAAEIDPAELGPRLLAESADAFRRGAEDEGQKALDELVRVRPDLPIPEDYPPLFKTLHQRALQKAKARAQGSIGFTDGTQLNGRTFPRGVTRVTEVPAGEHYLTANGRTQRITVGGVELLIGDREAIMLGDSVSFFDTKPPRKVIAGGLASSAAVGGSRPPVVIHAKPVEENKGVAPPAPPPAKVKESGTPLYKQWWLWTAVGVVAAGVGIGLAVGLTAKVGKVQVEATW